MPTRLFATILLIKICVILSTEANVQLRHTFLDLSLIWERTIDHLAYRCSVLQCQGREFIRKHTPCLPMNSNTYFSLHYSTQTDAHTLASLRTVAMNGESSAGFCSPATIRDVA